MTAQRVREDAVVKWCAVGHKHEGVAVIRAVQPRKKVAQHRLPCAARRQRRRGDAADSRDRASDMMGHSGGGLMSS